MLVCHCKGVSDRAIRTAVRDGAASVAEVARSCGAGSRCGGCVDAVRELIHTEAAHHTTASSEPSVATFPNA